MSVLRQSLEQAVEESCLLETSAENILQLLERSAQPLYQKAIEQFVEEKRWSELDDRFFRTLAFGTGGLRGRSIGKVVAAAERGDRDAGLCPQFPCVGTNAMNFYNVSRATQGLVRYINDVLGGSGRKPSLAIAHDSRFFSREFAELAARVATENGCDVFLFESARSTPELSFAVRTMRAAAGIVITASHNPPHDNGYKVYFDDGAQVVEPHANGIIESVNRVAGENYQPLPENERGSLKLLGGEFDREYAARLKSLVLRPDLMSDPRNQSKIVFTPIHGTGAVISVPCLRSLGCHVSTVDAQMEMNGAFPTVQSPNPENAEALSLAMEQAQRENADLVIGTDPDSDRMGVAVRSRTNEMVLLNGNQIGSILADYRVRTFRELGILNDQNAGHAVFVKTLVTTDLQKTIAQRAGVQCVETLTGFKYIGAKLRKYEEALPGEIRADYRTLTEEETRIARLRYSRFFVFGGEESYGYSGADFVRDKDANGAVVMLAEIAAYAQAEGQTLIELLDQIYLANGFYTEKTGSLVFEGAEGSEKIKRLVRSYRSHPPRLIDGSEVKEIQDFSTGQVADVEGDLLPPEMMTMFLLEDGRKIAVRPSGTEPKIKFYLFGKSEAFDEETLAAAKRSLPASLDRLWSWLQADARERIS